jgi:hypothetical protein
MTNESAAIQAESLQREVATLKKYRWLLVTLVMIVVFFLLGVTPYYNSGGVFYGAAGLLIPICAGIVGFMGRLTNLTFAQQREIEKLKIRLAVLEETRSFTAEIRPDGV